MLRLRQRLRWVISLFYTSKLAYWVWNVSLRRSWAFKVVEGSAANKPLAGRWAHATDVCVFQVKRLTLATWYVLMDVPRGLQKVWLLENHVFLGRFRILTSAVAELYRHIVLLGLELKRLRAWSFNLREVHRRHWHVLLVVTFRKLIISCDSWTCKLIVVCKVEVFFLLLVSTLLRRWIFLLGLSPSFGSSCLNIGVRDHFVFLFWLFC